MVTYFPHNCLALFAEFLGLVQRVQSSAPTTTGNFSQPGASKVQPLVIPSMPERSCRCGGLSGSFRERGLSRFGKVFAWGDSRNSGGWVRGYEKFLLCVQVMLGCSDRQWVVHRAEKMRLPEQLRSCLDLRWFTRIGKPFEMGASPLRTVPRIGSSLCQWKVSARVPRDPAEERNI